MRRVSAEFVIRRTTCARAQFSGCSSTTNTHSETGQMAVCCQNLMLGALSSRVLCWKINGTKNASNICASSVQLLAKIT
jgi:hypothetical protein